MRIKGGKPESARLPYKFHNAKRDEFLQKLRNGMRRSKACDAVGIERTTFYDTLRCDDDFRAQVEKAESEANEIIEDALFQAAESGNVTAIQVWLYNRNPLRWQDRRNIVTTVTGADGGPIQISTIEVVKPDGVSE